MGRGLIAKKIGMASLFQDDGQAVPVTVLRAQANRVLQIKNKGKDGYDAVQLACNPVRETLLTKAQRGCQKGIDKPYRTLREFREFGPCEIGQELGVEIFKVGQVIKVIGCSKGKGFQGVMKRHGFSGGRATHGSHFHRAPGSQNASASPSRVFKGKKLPGHMGTERVTVNNLKIAAIDEKQGLIFVKGAVPGARKSCVTVEIMLELVET